MNNERRQHERLDCELSSSFRDLDKKSRDLSSQFAMIRNISEGGVRIRVKDFVPVTDRLILNITLPRSRSYEVPLKPAWISAVPNLGQYELGGRFVDITLESRIAIQRFLSEPKTA